MGYIPSIFYISLFCISNRLQVTAGKKDAPLTSPSEKRGTESSESKHTAGGIQIKISPAVDKPSAQTKVNSPPKTCFKVIGKYLSFYVYDAYDNAK